MDFLAVSCAAMFELVWGREGKIPCEIQRRAGVPWRGGPKAQVFLSWDALPVEKKQSCTQAGHVWATNRHSFCRVPQVKNTAISLAFPSGRAPPPPRLCPQRGGRRALGSSAAEKGLRLAHMIVIDRWQQWLWEAARGNVSSHRNRSGGARLPTAQAATPPAEHPHPDCWRAHRKCDGESQLSQ